MANSLSDVTSGLQQEWFNQALAQQKAVYEATLKMWSRLFAVPRVIELGTRRQGAAPRRHEVVYEEDSLRLLRYRRETPAVYAEPVLVCYALVNRPYIVDLQPDRSVIRQLLARGLRGLPDRLGRPLGRRPEHDPEGLRRRPDEELRRRTSSSGTRSTRLHLRRLLHGRHDVRHVHRPQPGAGQDAHPHGRADRLPAGKEESLVTFWIEPGVLRRGRPGRRLRQRARPRSSRPASR